MADERTLGGGGSLVSGIIGGTIDGVGPYAFLVVNADGSLNVKTTTGTGGSATGTPTQVALTGASQTILAANANRKGATVVNDSANTLFLLLSTGGTASASVYTVALGPKGTVGAYYEVPFGFTGAIIGFSTAASGNAVVTEMT